MSDSTSIDSAWDNSAEAGLRPGAGHIQMETGSGEREMEIPTYNASLKTG